MTPTELTLIALHKSPVARLEDVSERYFNMKPIIAARRARLNLLPVPTWRLGTRKSPLMVHLKDLAEYIDRSRDSAVDAWRKSQL